MDLLQLEYFIKVAECNSLTDASKSLLVSIPSLCATIKRLEQNVGCPLFDRVGRRLQLNDNGTILLRYATDALGALATAKEELQYRNGKHSGLALAITNRSIWIEAVNHFIIEHPSTNVSYNILNAGDLSVPCLHTSYDFILTGVSDFTAPDWNYDVLIKDDYPMLILYREHPLADRTSIDLNEVRNEPFVALNKGTFARRYFDDLFREANITPNIVINCDHLLRAPLIRSKYGLGITTRLGSKSEQVSGLICIPISQPKLIRAQALFHYSKRTLTPTALIFKQFMEEYFSDQH